MKVALYTSMMGDIDNLRPMPKGDLFDSFLFTDDPVALDSDCDLATHVQHVHPMDGDGRRNAKYGKVFPWRMPWLGQYDVSIWVDASAVIPDGDALVKMACASLPMGMWRHPDRDNIADEVAVSKGLHKYRRSTASLDDQLIEYGSHPGELWAAGVIVRDHTNPEVRDAMLLWWTEMAYWNSWQDQVSLPHALRKCGVEPKPFPENLWINQWVQWAHHNHGN